jgi:hypothetical protein
MQLWEKLAKGGVLLAPGWIFSPDQESVPDGGCGGHYRISFSVATVSVYLDRSCERLTHTSQFPEMERAIDIIAKVTKLFLEGE